MANKIDWASVDLRFFLDGEDIGAIAGTNFSSDTQLGSRSAKYQGRPFPSIDSTYNGERVSVTLEREEGTADIDRMMDAHEAGIKNRDGTGRISFVASHADSDGNVVAYRYTGCNVSRTKAGGQDQPVTETLNIEAENKERL